MTTTLALPTFPTCPTGCVITHQPDDETSTHLDITLIGARTHRINLHHDTVVDADYTNLCGATTIYLTREDDHLDDPYRADRPARINWTAADTSGSRVTLAPTPAQARALAVALIAGAALAEAT